MEIKPIVKYTAFAGAVFVVGFVLVISIPEWFSSSKTQDGGWFRPRT